MDMPHGIRVRRYKGGQDLPGLNTRIAKDGTDCYLVVHPNDRDDEKRVSGTVVYERGKPVMGFVTENQIDRPDLDMQAIALMASDGNFVVDVFNISEFQMQYLKDRGGALGLMIGTPGISQAVSGSPGGSAEADSAPAGVSGSARPADVGGRFLKAVNVSSAASYIQNNTGFTGCAVLNRNDGYRHVEYCFLIVKGTVLATFSKPDDGVGKDLYDRVSGAGGVIELYFLDEPTIMSLVEKYPAIAHRQYDPQPARAAVNVSVQQARDHTRVPEDVAEATAGQTHARHASAPVVASETERSDVSPPLAGATKSAEYTAPKPAVVDEPADSAAEYVRKVESDFYDNIDALLEKLEVAHLRKNSKK
jgi:hypothetical protein